MSLEDFTRPMMVQGPGVIMTMTAGPTRRAFLNDGGFDVACAAIHPDNYRRQSLPI